VSQHMHQLRWVLSAVVLSVSAPGWYGSPAPVLGADPDAAEILPRWRHHAESIETLRVKWKQQITYAPGSYHGKDLRTHDENGREFPGKSAEVTSDCRVVLKGQKWRYETIGVKWQPEVEQFAASEDITASDGTTVTSFQGIDASIDKAHPLAFLYRSETTISKARMPVAAPVFLFARPFQKPIGHLLRWEGTAPSVRQSAMVSAQSSSSASE